MAPDRILKLAETNGVFAVSWRWRDEKLMRTCKKLVAKGLLRFDSGRGETLFYPTAVRAPQTERSE